MLSHWIDFFFCWPHNKDYHALPTITSHLRLFMTLGLNRPLWERGCLERYPVSLFSPDISLLACMKIKDLGHLELFYYLEIISLSSKLSWNERKKERFLLAVLGFETFETVLVYAWENKVDCILMCKSKRY